MSDDDEGAAPRWRWRAQLFRQENVPGADSGRRAAAIGGAAACGGTLLLPLHVLGGSAAAVAVLFAVAGVSLAAATVAWGAALIPGRGRRPRYWALAGAMSFLIGGLGLLADSVGHPMIVSEVVAVLVLAAWWAVVAVHHVARATTRPGARLLAVVSAVSAMVALAAAAAQLLASPPAGAVPARIAYLAWGPWGLALAYRLRAGGGASRRRHARRRMTAPATR